MSAVDSQPQKEVVLDPVTAEPIKDETLAIAVKEGTHWITRRGKPRTVVDWDRFLKSRRTHMAIPRYYHFTDRQVQLHMKIKDKDTLTPIAVIGAVWGRRMMREVLYFITAKKMPVYRWPKLGGSWYVFYGDILRAIESCEVDIEKDGGAWQKYLLKREHWNKKARDKNADRRVLDNQVHAAPQGPAGASPNA